MPEHEIHFHLFRRAIALAVAASILLSITLVETPRARASTLDTPWLSSDDFICPTLTIPLPVDTVTAAGVLPVPGEWFHQCRLKSGEIYVRNLTRSVWILAASRLDSSATTHVTGTDKKWKYRTFHEIYQRVVPGDEAAPMLAPGERVVLSVGPRSLHFQADSQTTMTWQSGRSLYGSLHGLSTALAKSLFQASSPLAPAVLKCLTAGLAVYAEFNPALPAPESRARTMFADMMSVRGCATAWDEGVAKVTAAGYKAPTARQIVLETFSKVGKKSYLDVGVKAMEFAARM